MYPSGPFITISTDSIILQGTIPSHLAFGNDSLKGLHETTLLGPTHLSSLLTKDSFQNIDLITSYFAENNFGGSCGFQDKVQTP